MIVTPTYLSFPINPVVQRRTAFIPIEKMGSHLGAHYRYCETDHPCFSWNEWPVLWDNWWNFASGLWNWLWFPGGWNVDVLGIFMADCNIEFWWGLNPFLIAAMHGCACCNNKSIVLSPYLNPNRFISSNIGFIAIYSQSTAYIGFVVIYSQSTSSTPLLNLSSLI